MLSQPGKATKIEHQIHHRDLESGLGQPDGSYLLAPHRFVLSEDMFDRGPSLRTLAVRLTRTSIQRPIPVAAAVNVTAPTSFAQPLLALPAVVRAVRRSIRRVSSGMAALRRKVPEMARVPDRLDRPRLARIDRPPQSHHAPLASHRQEPHSAGADTHDDALAAAGSRKRQFEFAIPRRPSCPAHSRRAAAIRFAHTLPSAMSPSVIPGRSRKTICDARLRVPSGERS